MTISVTVNDKHRNLNRDASEPVEKALFRLQNGFAPKPSAPPHPPKKLHNSEHLCTRSCVSAHAP